MNTFAFLPDSVARESAPGIKLLPPELKPTGAEGPTRTVAWSGAQRSRGDRPATRRWVAAHTPRSLVQDRNAKTLI